MCDERDSQLSNGWLRRVGVLIFDGWLRKVGVPGFVNLPAEFARLRAFLVD